MQRKLKTITQRLDKADELLDGMEAVGGAVGDAIAGSLGVALLPGESVPDLRLLLALLQRRVAGLARRVAIGQEIAADWQECERFYAEGRDAAAARVLRKLIRLRSLAKGMFGPSGPELIGLAGQTPRQPKALLEAAKAVTFWLWTWLWDPDTALPAVATPYLEVDLAPVAAELEADVVRLEECLDEGAKAHASFQAAQDARQRAMNELDFVAGVTADLTESLCMLAGRPDLADLIAGISR